MRRRDFIRVVAAGVAMWPAATIGQRNEIVRRVGVALALSEADPETRKRLAAFQQELQRLGWMEGRNLRIEYRWAADDPKLTRAFAAELVAQQPDVLFAAPTSMAAAVQRETKSIPVVFAQVADPVEAGLVASMARPGGNITGFSHFEFDVGAKWIELLKEIAPRIVRVAVMYDPSNSASTGYFPAMELEASKLALDMRRIAVRDRTEIEQATDAFAGPSGGGVVLLPGPLMGAQRQLIVEKMQQHKLPSIYAFRYHPAGGGLASYGVDLVNLYRQAAGYVDRILKGTRPADLPVQAPTRYELVINLKAAQMLGLAVAPSLVARADEVIE